MVASTAAVLVVALKVDDAAATRARATTSTSSNNNYHNNDNNGSGDSTPSTTQASPSNISTPLSRLRVSDSTTEFSTTTTTTSSSSSSSSGEETSCTSTGSTLVGLPLSGSTSSEVLILTRAPRHLRREGVLKSDDMLNNKGVHGSQANREVFAGWLAKTLGLANTVPRAVACHVGFSSDLAATCSSTTTATTTTTTPDLSRFVFLPFVKGKSLGCAVPEWTEELKIQASELLAFEILIGNADMHEDNLYWGAFPRSPECADDDDDDSKLDQHKQSAPRTTSSKFRPAGCCYLPSLDTTTTTSSRPNDNRMRLVAIDHGLSMGQHAPDQDELQFSDVFRMFDLPFAPAASEVIRRAEASMTEIETAAYTLLGTDHDTTLAIALMRRRLHLLSTAVAEGWTVGETVHKAFSAEVEQEVVAAQQGVTAAQQGVEEEEERLVIVSSSEEQEEQEQEAPCTDLVRYASSSPPLLLLDGQSFCFGVPVANAGISVIMTPASPPLPLLLLQHLQQQESTTTTTTTTFITQPQEAVAAPAAAPAPGATVVLVLPSAALSAPCSSSSRSRQQQKTKQQQQRRPQQLSVHHHHRHGQRKQQLQLQLKSKRSISTTPLPPQSADMVVIASCCFAATTPTTPVADPDADADADADAAKGDGNDDDVHKGVFHGILSHFVFITSLLSVA